MKVAAIQMVSGCEVRANLDAARRALEEAARGGAQLAALPEYFCLMGRHDTDKLDHAEEPGQGPIQECLSRAARELGLWVVGGTLPLRVPGDERRVFNACLAFDPQGRQVARYDKIHLFRYDDGRQRYDESQVLRAGTTPTRFSCPITGPGGPATLEVGLSVCYDLRFPELYRRLNAGPTPCDLLIVPSAFTYPTGLAHWELLLRARAVENQCYVLAPAQGGTHDNGRRTFGHTMLVDPWGEIQGVLPEGAGVVLGDIDFRRLHEVRNQLPALTHRVLF
jgi:nitrilase